MCADVVPFESAQDDGGVYGVGNDGVIRRIGKSDGSVLALGGMNTGGVAVAGGAVYFSGDGHILRVPSTGGSEELIVQDAAGATRLAADAGHVYYGDGAGRVFSAPAMTDASTTLIATVGQGISQLVSDDTRLYFAAQVDATDPYGSHLFDSIEEIGKDGSNHTNFHPHVSAINAIALMLMTSTRSSSRVSRHWATRTRRL